MFLTKLKASDYLTHELGLPTSAKSLSKYITVGGGPEYQKFGHRVVYTPSNLEKWAMSKLSKLLSSSSQGVENADKK